MLQGATDSFTSSNGWAGLTATGTHQLLVDGSAGSVVMANDATWTAAGTVTHNGEAYNVYNDIAHNAQLLVDTHLTRSGPIGG